MILHINLYWAEHLLNGEREHAIIRWLTSCAPQWCRTVSVIGRKDKKIPLNLEHPRWLTEATDLSMTDYMREERSRLLGDRPAPPAAEGSFELVGANRQIIAVIDSNLRGIWRRRDGVIGFLNSVSLHIEAERVEGRALADWAYDCFVSGCRDIRPEYAYAFLYEEYDALNMDRSHGVRAIGRDFAKYLPGIYWLNYFGPHLTAVLDRERLLSAPASTVQTVGEGVLLVQRERPEDWNLPEVVARRRAIRYHLGAGYFFDRDDQTTSPSGLGYE